MLPARALADPPLKAVTTAPALLTREECAAWQIHAERLAHRHGHPERMLEFALSALQYAAEGASPEEALHLAQYVLFVARPSRQP